VSQSLIDLAAVLEVFALLLSNHWTSRWEKKWRLQRALPARIQASRGRRARLMRSKKKSPRRQFYQRIFSLRVTRAGGADRLGGRGRKLSRKVRSTKTSAYNQARQRLPVALLQDALAHLRGGLLRLVGLQPAPKVKPGPRERTRQIFDGSTLAMLATPKLAKAYPPARNRYGASDWCLMRILVGFCARSGAVLSGLEGSVRRSEQAMAWVLMEQAARFVIWIGDRNFGVWSVVAQAVRYEQDALVRMTQARATKLCGGRVLKSGQERRIQWSPSRHDQVPPGAKRDPISGRLIYVRLRKSGTWIHLWLFTTLDADDYPIALLVKWYGERWQAELHFRSVKTQLKMAELQVRTPEMARKEFYGGLLAYSVVRAVMWKGGERLEAGIKAISFSQARRVLISHLNTWGTGLGKGAKDLKIWIRLLLEEVAQQTLPKRRKRRPTEIRKVRHRRLKFPAFHGSRAAARVRDLITKSL